jgi:hypothetical protein
MFQLRRSLARTRLLVTAGIIAGAVFAGAARADGLGISSPVSVNEGAAAQLAGTVPVGTLSNGWSYAGVSAPANAACGFSSATSLSPTFTCNDAGTYSVALAADGVSTTSTITVADVAPWTWIRAPSSGYLTSRYFPVNVYASFSDPGFNDTHTCWITWGDGKTTQGFVSESGGNGTCRASHVYGVGGWWGVSVSVFDDDGLSGVSLPISVRTL